MDNLDTTLFRLPVLGLLFSPTSSGRNFAAICVNDALINEIMLFGIISKLISRITRPVSLFHSTYLSKFTATFILDFRKETRSLEAIQEFGVQFALLSKALNDVRAFL